jgi:hypothetical protein
MSHFIGVKVDDDQQEFHTKTGIKWKFIINKGIDEIKNQKKENTEIELLKREVSILIHKKDQLQVEKYRLEKVVEELKNMNKKLNEQIDLFINRNDVVE